MRVARRDQQKRDVMRAEYDFSAGVRGKYAEQFAQGSRVVVLAPDVAEVFRTAREVNAVLGREIRRRPSSMRGPRRRR